MRHPVAWQIVTDVSERRAASFVREEDGDNRFLQNVDKVLGNYMTSLRAVP
jgi:hypothetical protein